MIKLAIVQLLTFFLCYGCSYAGHKCDDGNLSCPGSSEAVCTQQLCECDVDFIFCELHVQLVLAALKALFRSYNHYTEHKHTFSLLVHQILHKEKILALIVVILHSS